jgi:hypothetical protein
VHQSINIAGLGAGGFLGLAGRVVNGACSGQGVAYLTAGFSGCALAATPGLSTYSGIALVAGDVSYGFGYDNACAPPGICGIYSGSSGVTLTRLDAQLALTVDPDPRVGLGAVPAGHPLTFRATVTPATLGSYATPISFVDGWTYTTDSGATERLGDCHVDQGSCAQAFYESGSLSLDAMVNGVRMTRGPVAVVVVQPTLELTVSKTEAAIDDTVLVTMSLRPEGEREDWIDFSVSAQRWWPPDEASSRSAPTGTSLAPSGPRRASLAPGGALRASMVDGLSYCGTTNPFEKRCYIIMGDTGVVTVTVDARYNRLPISASKTIRVSRMSSVMKFDRHAAMIRPSVYPFAATSACRSASTSVRPQSWGLTLTEGDATSARPQSNQAVSLTIGVMDTSGHHLAHVGARPLGSFAGDTSIVTSATVVTDAAGRASFKYYAPEFSGVYWVRAEGRGVEKVDTFTVGVPLEAVPGRDVDWIPYGEGRAQHRDVYYASQNMRLAADSLARAYAAQYRGKHLYFNDMGLPLGGRFDINGKWAADEDHCSHRFGNALDLRTDVLRPKEFEWVRGEWDNITHLGAPYYHRGHYHLQTPRQF